MTKVFPDKFHPRAGGWSQPREILFYLQEEEIKRHSFDFFFFNTWKGGSCLCLVFHLYWILEMSIETQSCKIKLVQKGKLSFVWFRSNWCLCLVPVRTGIKFIKLTTIDMMTIISYIGEICFNFNTNFKERMKTKYLFSRAQSTGDSRLYSEQFLRWFGSSPWLTGVPPGVSDLEYWY